MSILGETRLREKTLLGVLREVAAKGLESGELKR
jgi:hypothetical protein